MYRTPATKAARQPPAPAQRTRRCCQKKKKTDTQVGRDPSPPSGPRHCHEPRQRSHICMGRPRTATAGELADTANLETNRLSGWLMRIWPCNRLHAKAKKYLLCNWHKTTPNYGVPRTGLDRRRRCRRATVSPVVSSRTQQIYGLLEVGAAWVLGRVDNFDVSDEPVAGLVLSSTLQ